MDLEKLKHPIGLFTALPAPTHAQLLGCVAEIEQFPALLKKTVAGLTEAQCGSRYRPGGWTLRQVVNHVADSHMNGYFRVKLAATENNPVFKAYVQNLWAGTEDGKNAPLSHSIQLLEGLTARWVQFMKSLGEKDFQRNYTNLDTKKEFTIAWAVQLYAWHGRHHLEHVKLAIQSPALD